MTFSLLLATFCGPNCLFAFYSLQRCQLTAKRASTRKYLRGLGNLCSSTIKGG